MNTDQPSRDGLLNTHLKTDQSNSSGLRAQTCALDISQGQLIKAKTKRWGGGDKQTNKQTHMQVMELLPVFALTQTILDLTVHIGH
jgi:hypothetical protein